MQNYFRWLVYASSTCLCVASAVSAQGTQAARVQWQPEWRKVQPLEYVATAVLAGAALTVTLAVDPRTSGGYGGFLFDGSSRRALRAESRGGRDRARTVGDLGYRSLAVFPFLDAALGLLIHGDSEVAGQMFAMNFEAMAFAGFIGIMTDHFIGRARPSVPECRRDPRYERFCNQADAYASFVSGHSVIAAANAGVTCAHHLSLPLYGGGAGDIAVCAAASALALTTGIARIVNDRHWATDVVVAWLAGAAIGYVWPRFFHYRSRELGTASAASDSLSVMPSLAPGFIGGTLAGAL